MVVLIPYNCFLFFLLGLPTEFIHLHLAMWMDIKGLSVPYHSADYIMRRILNHFKSSIPPQSVPRTVGSVAKINYFTDSSKPTLLFSFLL